MPGTHVLTLAEAVDAHGNGLMRFGFLLTQEIMLLSRLSIFAFANVLAVRHAVVFLSLIRCSDLHVTSAFSSSNVNDSRRVVRFNAAVHTVYGMNGLFVPGQLLCIFRMDLQKSP